MAAPTAESESQGRKELYEVIKKMLRFPLFRFTEIRTCDLLNKNKLRF